MRIKYSFYRNAYVSRCIVFLYKVTAIYWPGMRNTAFLVFFTNLCERDHFDNDVVSVQNCFLF